VAIKCRKLFSDISCSNCNDKLKKVRHCPFIPKKDWQGNVTYPVEFADGSKEFLEECPSGFIKLNQRYQVFFDSYSSMQNGHPIIWGKGFLELPNILVLGMGIVGEEYWESKTGKKRTKKLEAVNNLSKAT